MRKKNITELGRKIKDKEHRTSQDILGLAHELLTKYLGFGLKENSWGLIINYGGENHVVKVDSRELVLTAMGVLRAKELEYTTGFVSQSRAYTHKKDQAAVNLLYGTPMSFDSDEPTCVVIDSTTHFGLEKKLRSRSELEVHYGVARGCELRALNDGLILWITDPGTNTCRYHLNLSHLLEAAELAQQKKIRST